MRLSSSTRPNTILLCLLVQQTSALFNLFGGSGPTCPSVTPVVENFDIDEYIEASWYIQRQQVNTYQSADTLFCVVATYEREGRQQWFQEAITVINFSNEGGVNEGARAGTGFGGLCATLGEGEMAGSLRVAPCFLPPFLGGPYWVVAYSPGSWAIITGGQLSVLGSCGEEEGVCTTRESGSIFDPLSFIGNNQGLWFFTRDPLPDASVLEEMEAAAASLGICTANMLDVVHEGCTYEGTTIKA